VGGSQEGRGLWEEEEEKAGNEKEGNVEEGNEEDETVLNDDMEHSAILVAPRRPGRSPSYGLR
jgi:hypothetical protein